MTYSVRFIIGSLALVAVLMVLTFVANAQPVACAPMKETMRKLLHEHKELLIFRGISARGHITIIHLNEDTGNWTASVIRPTDPTLICGVDAGTTGELIETNDEANTKNFWCTDCG